MRVRMKLHVELADAAPVWWAESPDLAGFTAAANDLAELRRLIREELDERSPDVAYSEELVGDRSERADVKRASTVAAVDARAKQLTAV